MADAGTLSAEAAVENDVNNRLESLRALESSHVTPSPFQEGEEQETDSLKEQLLQQQQQQQQLVQQKQLGPGSNQVPNSQSLQQANQQLPINNLQPQSNLQQPLQAESNQQANRDYMGESEIGGISADPQGQLNLQMGLGVPQLDVTLVQSREGEQGLPGKENQGIDVNQVENGGAAKSHVEDLTKLMPEMRVEMKPGKWQMSSFLRTSIRWENPREWEFKILKAGSIFDAGPMFTNYFSTPQKVTKPLGDVNQLLEKLQPNQMRILWIGHATLLIQMEGKNILTDPMFSDFAGLNWVVGYKRYRKPAVTVEQLRNAGVVIHAVVISHNHYDHFDEQSIKDLNKQDVSIKWFVPMGLKKAVQSWGCQPELVQEFEWWQPPGECHGLKFHFTPAKHWSSRSTRDWYKTLWGSWVIEGQNLTFYFAGDTGYQEELFGAIAGKFPDIDVAALPIGAYEPRDMMKCQHINPAEAVIIHNTLKVQLSVGIHWATFQLSAESVEQTKEDLQKALKEVEQGEFKTLEDDLITIYTKSGQQVHKSGERGDEPGDRKDLTPNEDCQKSCGGEVGTSD